MESDRLAKSGPRTAPRGFLYYKNKLDIIEQCSKLSLRRKPERLIFLVESESKQNILKKFIKSQPEEIFYNKISAGRCSFCHSLSVKEYRERFSFMT